MLVVPFGARERPRVVVGLVRRAARSPTSGCWPRCGRSSSACPRSSWRSRGGSPTNTARRSRGRWVWCCPPGATRRLGGRRRARPQGAVGRRPVGARIAPDAQLSSEQRGGAGAAAGGDRATALRTAPAARRHRLGQDRGLPARLRGGARAGSRRDRDGARDRAHAADRLALRRALRRDRGGAALAPDHRPALRRVAPAARGRGANLRRAPARPCSRPSDELGLIVVDEEHEASYKHEGDPRYDAREVAEERARRAGALLLLGSATPRPESVMRLTSSRLQRRVDGRPLPPVEVLDMRGQPSDLHPTTVQALAEVRSARRQGDRAAQPPRLVELPLLPLLRARLGVPRMRRRRSCCTAPRACSPVTTAGTASRSPTRCPQCSSSAVATPRRGHRAARPRPRRASSTTATSRSSASTPTRSWRGGRAGGRRADRCRCGAGVGAARSCAASRRPSRGS